MDQYPTHPVFDPILVAETDRRIARTIPGAGDEVEATRRLVELLEALTDDQVIEYGEYRKIFAK